MQILFTLEKAKKDVRRHFSKNPRASISAMYRNLRKDSSLSAYGDYVLFARIVNTLTDIGIVIKKKTLGYAMRQSPELKGKSILLKELMRPQRMFKYSFKLPRTELSKDSVYKLHSKGEKAK